MDKLNYSYEKLHPSHVEIFKNKKVTFLTSTSQEFKNSVRGRSVHINSHGEIHGRVFLGVPNETRVRLVSPIGSLLYSDRGSKQNAQEIEKLYLENLKILKEKMDHYHDYEEIKKEYMELQKKFLKFVPQFELFNIIFDISYEQWYEEIFFRRIFLYKTILPYNDFKSYRELEDQYNSTKKMDETTFLKLVFDYISELSKYADGWLKENHPELLEENRGFIIKLIENEKNMLDIRNKIIALKSPMWDILDKNIEIMKKYSSNMDKIGELRQNKPLDERILFYNNINKLEGAPNTENIKEGLSFTFEEGSTVPMIMVSGKQNSKKLYEQYLNIIIQDEHNNYCPHHIYVADHKFEFNKKNKRPDISLYKIFKIFKDLGCTITFWACMGVDDNPFWYKNKMCLGEPRIGNDIMGYRRRSEMSILYEIDGLHKFYHKKKLRRTIKLEDLDQSNLPISIPPQEEFIIEKNLSKIKLGLIKEAFLNTFSTNINSEPELLEDIYNFFRDNKDIIKQIEDNFFEAEPTVDNNFPLNSAYTYYKLEEQKPTANEILRKDNLYLKILYNNIYEYFKSFDSEEINFLSDNDFYLYETPKNINLEIPLISNFGKPTPLEEIDIYPFERYEMIEEEKRNFFNFNNVNIEYTKCRPVVDSPYYSDFDYDELILCLVFLFSQNIVYDREGSPYIDIDTIINEYPVKKDLGHLLEDEHDAEHKIAKLLTYIRTRLKVQ